LFDLLSDNKHWYYIHHHLDHSQCNHAGASCQRNMFISPLNFRTDGSIEPVFPAENLHVEIYQTASDSNDQSLTQRHRAQRIALE
jgi:hypothetical protein